MSMKRTDLAKNLAKKLDGHMKGGSAPQRFGSGSTAARQSPEEKAQPAAPKLVAVSFKLPADLVIQLRERAIGVEGGMGAVIATAAAQWLAGTPAVK